jgi:hypothetical protein
VAESAQGNWNELYQNGGNVTFFQNDLYTHSIAHTAGGRTTYLSMGAGRCWCWAPGATIGQAASHYYCCPWSSIYQVRRPVTIAGRRLRPMQQFTFDVSAEEMAEGGQFTRRSLPGPIHTTSEVDYCDPTSGD